MERRIGRTPIGPDPAERVALAVASLAAGAIHAAVVPEHLDESMLFGAFFVVTAIFQVGWAALVLVRRDSLLPTVGAVANGTLVILWIVSRTVGVPVGPEPWMPEPKGVLDVSATILEVILVAIALVWSDERTRERDATS
jgi:peptidoglycan/LPS O-acetylase OafA/YrhL